MPSMADRIAAKLTAGLSPMDLRITDESHQHEGHAGHQPGGETHFHVAATSKAFAGLNRVQRQRLVYGLLKDELAGQVHALSLSLKAPGE